MPTYSTRCDGCGATHDIRLSFEQYEGVRSGSKVLECAACKSKVSLMFDPGDVTFILKDGESGGWSSKAQKENQYRAKRQRVMERRQRDHIPQRKLVPNFAGGLAPSWKDAQEVAREVAYTELKGQGVDHERSMAAANEAAATYNPLVKQELAR